MIAAATQNIVSGKTWINWFDVALILVIAFGFWRGRRNGMTKEFLPVSQWLVVIIASGFGYKPLGDVFIRQGFIRNLVGKSIAEETVAYVSSYIIIALAVAILFSLVKHRLKAKLEGSSFFGSSEYYFGMVSGVIRYVCMVIFALALLNAPVYSAADIAQQKYLANKIFGGGLAGYSGDFFPTVSETQTSVFKDSLTGPFLKDYLSDLLINSVRYVPPSSSKQVIYMGK